jgi:AcrR family transcriptional regulator
METTNAQAAKEVFAEQGYHQATLEEIAQRIDPAKSTIYSYFKNKDDLFLPGTWRPEQQDNDHSR